MLNSRLIRPRGVVFDLDGTLVDRAPDLVGALDTVIGELGAPPLGQARARNFIGDGAAQLVERGMVASNLELDALPRAIERFRVVYGGRVARSTRPYPGAVEMLRRLAARGVRLAICTNKPDALTDTLLGALDLAGHFAVVVGGDVPARKPDPRHLAGTLAKLGVAAAEAVMVGDSPNDVRAAKGAGVAVVAVTFGYTATPPSELGADALVDRLDELPVLFGY